jgi:1-acyl-sn-glycerol-3-phosphate acyltransferase
VEGEVSEVMEKKRPIINFSKPFKLASFLVFHAVMMLIIPFDLLVFSLRTKGRKNAEVRRALLVSNHILYLDGPVILHTIWPRRSYFSALEETCQIPFLGTFVRFLGAFPLPERNPMKQVLAPIKRALSERGFVHFFPEGELYRLNQHLKGFQDGVFFFSILTNVPVIPITLVTKKRRPFGKELSILPHQVTSIVGEPVYPETFLRRGVSRKEAIVAMSRHLRQVMQETIDAEHKTK